MKRNNLILGSVGVIATAAFIAVSPWKSTDSKGTYTQEPFSALSYETANDAKLWLERRYLDPETGERISDKKLRQIEAGIKQVPKSRAVTFIEQGPDNIGGRTRAIQVDVTDNDIIWAGGVSGGLFKSMNGANTWERVESYEGVGSPFISSMCQLADGTLFVATGSNEEGWSGNGLWYTQDAGDSWTLVPGTNSFSSGRVTEVIAPTSGTTVWLTSSSGLKTYDVSTNTLTNIPIGGANSPCLALAASPNGQVIVAAIGGSKSTYVSNDFGATFVDRSGPSANGTVPFGAGRIEYAVSQAPNSSGNYSIYAVRTGLNLQGMNVSHDSGNTWSQFIGASGTPSNLDIYRDQGGYNSVVTVTPQNPEKILIGGIDVWKWEQTTNNPPAGGFEKLSEWFLAPTSSKYVHADNHEMKWDGTRLYIGNDGGIGVTDDPEVAFYPANRGYNVTQFYGIAFDRDGAVMGGTQDNGTLYNDHQLSTWLEFTEIGGGDGFQCDISFFNPRVIFMSTYYGVGRRSTDKGETSEDFYPEVWDAANSVYNVGLENASVGTHPFHTRLFLAEYYDLNSEDSVLFIPDANYGVGETIKVPSAASGDTINYTLTSPLYYSDTLSYDPSLSVQETSIVDELSGQIVLLGLNTWSHVGTSGSGMNPPIVGDSILVTFPSGISDTMIVESLGSYTHYYATNPSNGAVYDMETDSVLYNVAWNNVTVQDPYQSWYVMYANINGGELWATRNALRLSAQDVQWGIIARNIGGSSFNTIDVEFSRDLNQMYVSTGGSTVTRIDGLSSLYTSSSTFEEDAFYHDSSGVTLPPNGTTVTTFNPGGQVEGICVNPSDANDVVVVTGFGSNNIKRSLNAASASPTFTNVGSIPGNPGTYDVIIDRNDDQILVVGTSHGVFVTEDGGASWTDGSAGFTGTPVYEVRQSWRTWNEGNFRPGEIYIGTFGRGIWSSDSYLSVGDNNTTDGNSGTSIEEFDTNLFPYPNPTTASTSVSFELANTSDVTIQVYSLSGKLVKSINKKNMSQGSQVVDLDGADLSVGTYVVKLFAGKQQATTKFVKM